MKLSVLSLAALSAPAFAAPHGDPNTAAANEANQVNARYTIPTNASDLLSALSALSAIFADPPEIQIEMRGDPQRVGQFHGQRLWEEVQHGLDTACKKRTSCSIASHTIGGVEYVDKSGRLAINADMELFITHFHIPKNLPNVDAVVRAMIDAIAYVFKAETDESQNCVDKVVKTNDGKGDVRIYHCQIGEAVYFTAKGGTTVIHMGAALQFNSRTTKGVTYQCGREQVLDAVRGYMGNHIKPQLVGANNDFSAITDSTVICT